MRMAGSFGALYANPFEISKSHAILFVGLNVMNGAHG
jgi:hypothetical protein